MLGSDRWSDSTILKDVC